MTDTAEKPRQVYGTSTPIDGPPACVMALVANSEMTVSASFTNSPRPWYLSAARQ